MLFRLIRIIEKEFKEVRSHIVFSLVSIISPIFFLLVFYATITNDITFSSYIVDNSGQKNNELVDTIKEIKNPNGSNYLNIASINETEAELLTEQDRLYWYTEIPAGYISQTDSKTTVKINNHYYQVHQNFVKNIRNRVNLGVLTYVEDTILKNKAVKFSEERVNSKDITMGNVLASGLFTFVFFMAGIVNGGIVWAREFESKTIRLIKLSPGKFKAVFCGKFITAFILTLLSGAFFFFFSNMLLAFIPANPVQLIALCLILSVFTVLTGFLLGMVLKHSIPLFIVGLIGSVVLWILSGGVGTLGMFSPAVQMAAKLFPMHYYLQMIRGSFNSVFNTALFTDIIMVAFFFIFILFLLYIVYKKSIIKEV